MFLGLEIGGTKLQLGVGRGDGAIVALERARVEPAGGAEGIRKQILEVLPALLAKANLRREELRGVGIGFGGPVDSDAGRVAKSHQIAGWEDFPLVEWFDRELRLPAVLHNDADTAGLAEACFGAGRGLSPIFYITIGSGIGGGLIIDQKIYRGAGAGAGEIGHLVVARPFDFLRPDFECGGGEFWTRVEDFASGWAIGRRAQRILRIHLDGTRDASEQDVAEIEFGPSMRQLLALAGNDIGCIDIELIVRAARSGNKWSLRLLTGAFKLFGWAIAQVVTLLCPRRVVIGGGVSLIGEELFFKPVREAVARYVFPPFKDCFDIVPAALGEEVVIHGALRLAAQQFGNSETATR